MPKLITKSIRLTEEEARDLSDLVEDHAASEAALMRQWVLRGMRQFRIEQAVVSYQRDEVDLRGGALMAQVPIGVFLEELAARRVAVLDDPASVLEELADLRAAFGLAEERPGVTAPHS